MAPKRIVAVAVAAENREIDINSRRDLKDLRRLKVRPYLRGLVHGLAMRGYQLRDDYVIHFRQRIRDAMTDAPAFGNPAAGDLIFCMSTTVVKAAAGVFTATAMPLIPIVGIVSEPDKETNNAMPAVPFDQIPNICGVSAKRTQSAAECFERFLRAVPTLREVKVPATTAALGYGPSNRALKDVSDAADAKNIVCTPLRFDTVATLEQRLDSLAIRDPDAKGGAGEARVGVLILPIDMCLSQAQEIIDLVQGEKKLPVFFPVPDWVKPDASGAFGAYGVSQRTCGELMAERVSVIWRNNDAVPTSASFKRWVSAPEDAFEFVVSAAVADADELNIKLPPKIPRV